MLMASEAFRPTVARVGTDSDASLASLSWSRGKDDRALSKDSSDETRTRTQVIDTAMQTLAASFYLNAAKHGFVT